jgi:hypothetical protein
MCYVIRIGNRAQADTRVPWQHVKVLELDEAPAFPGDDRARLNERMPSSAIWERLVAEAGLQTLFFSPETGLFAQFPGCAALTQAHLAEVRVAVETFRGRHPAAAPRFAWDERDLPADADLARLLWLEWWMGWALTHCQNPAIYNA